MLDRLHGRFVVGSVLSVVVVAERGAELGGGPFERPVGSRTLLEAERRPCVEHGTVDRSELLLIGELHL